MTDQEKDAYIDSIVVSRHGKAKGEYPAYPLNTFTQKIRKNRTWFLDDLHAEHHRANVWTPNLKVFELDDLLRFVRNSQLTTPQKEVFGLWLPGRPLVEIGFIRGHSKQAAQKILKLCFSKLRNSISLEPSFGLHDVMCSEMARWH